MLLDANRGYNFSQVGGLAVRTSCPCRRVCENVSSRSQHFTSLPYLSCARWLAFMTVRTRAICLQSAQDLFSRTALSTYTLPDIVNLGELSGCSSGNLACPQGDQLPLKSVSTLLSFLNYALGKPTSSARSTEWPAHPSTWSTAAGSSAVVVSSLSSGNEHGKSG